MKNLVLGLSAAAILTTGASGATMTMTGVIGGGISGANFVMATVGTVAGANNYPAAESPDKINDTLSSTKYLNFQRLNTGVIVTPDAASAVLPLNQLTFTTANDSPNRDPLTFTLYGSATLLTGAGPWATASMTPIVTGALTGLATDPGRFVSGGAQTFSNNTAFVSYLLVFPTVRDTPTVANSMQISEIGFASIPEPGTTALAGLALLGLARRKR